MPQHRILYPLGLSPCDYVRRALKELHWLPVTYRIQYKIALLMFTAHDNRCSPVYLSESVQPASSNPARQRLRSVSRLDFIVPRTRTKFGDRTFSVAGPTVWNSLPESTRSAETLASFKRSLKPICSIFHFTQFLSLITFRMSHRRRKMYCGHVHPCACLSLSMAACPHYCTDTDVTWRSGMGCPLVVHYWADLQSVHGLHCYGNIT